jgi:trimethylamine:corrinoid methyltransferase-like protein
MVLDNEVAGFIGQYLKGIRVDAERLSEELILEVGPLPGSYMNQAHTRKWYREEFLIPELSNREFFETWERGHTELQEKAKAKALEILDTHESPVAPEIQKEIDDFLDHVRRRDVE